MPRRKLKLGAGDLILNSPFEEPTLFWSYDRQYRVFTEKVGRRPAGYIVANPEAQGFDDPGQFIEMPLVNRIRERVMAWRAADYPGITGITRRLLEHWNDADEREGRRFFFCQLEAIETLIWLAEASPAERQGIAIPGDGGAFQRWCTKLATGTGKTVVMAMLIAWQALNRVTYGDNPRFSKHILVIAPGLTVKNRLAVLVPDVPGNYYDEFNIVPHGLFDALRQARVIVHNWHTLAFETAEQFARVRSVDQRKRMPRSDEAWLRDVLHDLAGVRDWLVINDEAHHAWRVSAESKVKGVSKDDLEEATKWIGGLDRIHRARGIARCFDFSATPFAPSGRKSSEEALFEWIVSDFGLNDAIESGLVKTPRVVVRDNGRLTPEYKSRFFHLYRDETVTTDVNRKAEPHEPLPDIVTLAYTMLGTDWQATATDWREAGHPVPPVMITVANRTETAARIKFAFDKEKIHIAELCAPERTLHIDSKVLAAAESLDEAVALANEIDEEDGDEEQPRRKLTKQEQAELLRRQVDTVGQPGQPGAHIQNVISVGMLSEGWDAKTVTHILGLRAFTSQLLCEQVVGRGLRRTSYDINPETKLFEPEYVNIFGVPFTFLPHEGDVDGPPPPTPKPKTRVEPLKDREQKYGITWPNVLRIEHVYRPRLSLDLRRVPALSISAYDTPTHAELAAMLEGKPNMEALSEIDLEELGRRNRMQTIVFKMARDVFDQMQSTWQGSKDVLLSQVIEIVEQVLSSNVVRMTPATYAEDELRRRILLTLNMNRIVQHIWEQIRFENTERLELVFDSQQPLRSTADMRPWDTSRPCEVTRKSHINVAVYDSTWEATESYELEHNPLVAAWVKNDHLGFEIMYVYRGVVRRYRPDYLIRLIDGITLILEVKGVKSEETDTKHRFLDEWVRGVNANGEFGLWSWDVSYNPANVPDILARHCTAP